MESHSLATQFNENDGASCGYCHQDSSSNSYGMFTHILTLDDYQNLIDRGWRRSGIYCYKPTLHKTCCPLYTIRCDVTNFSFSKSQKKIIKKFNKYLTDGETPECIADDDDLIDEPTASQSKREQNVKKPNSTYNKGVGFDPSKGLCKKAKQIRLEKKEEKLKAKGIATKAVVKNVQRNQEKTLEDLITELPENAKKKLKITLVKPTIKNAEWIATESDSYDLYVKYQMVIHNDPPEKLTKRQFERFLVKSPLQIKLVSTVSDDFKNTLKTSAKLFEKYQMRVHNDEPRECDETAYADFLVETPLLPETRNDVDYGSFHQQYWLDGELIAVGVIDILPKCVSSVYFFYDPELNNLSLGTFGVLREIHFTRQLKQLCPNLKYYYMGFYVHDCVKMKYKGNYHPSYLLCPETFEWFPLKDALAVLSGKSYARINPNPNAEDSDKFEKNDINLILIYDGSNSRIMMYGEYKNTLQYKMNRSDRIDESLLRIFGKLTGKLISRKIVLLV